MKQAELEGKRKTEEVQAVKNKVGCLVGWLVGLDCQEQGWLLGWLVQAVKNKVG